MNKITIRAVFLYVSIVLPIIATAQDSSFSLKRSAPLTKGPTITAAPDHLRMSSAIRIRDTYYLYCDYIRHDDPCAPGSFRSSLHLFTSIDLIHWEHRGEVIGPQTDEDSFGCVNVDVIYHDSTVYVYYLGIGKNGVETRKRNEGWNADPDDPNYLSSTIMVAESESPLGPFKKRTAILKTGPKGSWDSWKLVDPHVVKAGGKFYLYYKGFNAKSMSSRKVGLAISGSPADPFKKYEGNPIIDWSGKTGVEVPVTFNHHGSLGMLLMTFNPRKHVFLTSKDGIHWHIQDENFSEGMDIGLVKDHNNNLLPFYIQFTGKPLSLTFFNLQILERDGQP